MVLMVPVVRFAARCRSAGSQLGLPTDVGGSRGSVAPAQARPGAHELPDRGAREAFAKHGAYQWGRTFTWVVDYLAELVRRPPFARGRGASARCVSTDQLQCRCGAATERGDPATCCSLRGWSGHRYCCLCGMGTRWSTPRFPAKRLFGIVGPGAERVTCRRLVAFGGGVSRAPAAEDPCLTSTAPPPLPLEPA